MDNLYEEYRIAHNLPAIEDYGFAKEHGPKSRTIYDYISQVDLANGDAFYFKCGGDGEMLMDLLDMYFMRGEQNGHL